LFTFISVIFFTSKLADHSEIIAMLSSGISFHRFAVPYLLSAALIAGTTFLLAAYVIPPANVKRIEYTNKWVKNKRVDYGSNIQLQIKPGVIMYMSHYDNTTKQGFKFSLDKFDDKLLKSRLTAQSVKYDTLYRWTINDYSIRDFHGMRETITKGTSKDTILGINPKDFLIANNDQEMLTLPELKTYINRQKERGVANIKNFEIELHKRYATIGTAFILTIIGMSLSSRKTRGGMGINLGIGLALSFSYILFSTVTSSFAVSGVTSPLVAMWIPNAIFALIAIALYKKASL
jgi:lipopolysaccharide export system permease protein